MDRRNSMPNIDELLAVINALEDANYWGPPPSRDESKDDLELNEQQEVIKALESAHSRGTTPPSQDKSEADPAFIEQLEIIKALEDTDYWDPSPSSRDKSESDPAFDTPPEKFEVFDETNDWLPPTSYKFNGKDENEQLVSTHFDSALSTSSVSLHERSDNGRGDMAMSLLSAGLEGLGNTAAMAGTSGSNIIPISSLLLLTANIRDEMRQYQEEWEVIMDKLEKITTLLNNLGNWCALHDLEERDLPPSLRGLFPAFKAELDRVRHELEQSTNVRSTMKKILSRKETLRRVRKCDSKLSNLLQTFQVALAIDARLEQVKADKNSRRRIQCHD